MFRGVQRLSQSIQEALARLVGVRTARNAVDPARPRARVDRAGAGTRAGRRAVLGAALAFCLAGADAPAETPAPLPPTAPRRPRRKRPRRPRRARRPIARRRRRAPTAGTARRRSEAGRSCGTGAAGEPQNAQGGRLVAVLGKKVRDASGKDMGPVVDVLVDRRGLPLGAVIDFGGFLGVGSRKIAVDWHLLSFNPDDRKAPIELSLDRAEVKAAPEYKPADGRIEMVGPPPGVAGRAAVDGGK